METRSWWTVCGERSETRERVRDALRGLALDVLWVDEDPGDGGRWVSLGGLRRWLGDEVDVVVLDLSDGIDADAIGRAHGLVRGGGALVLRVDPERPGTARLAVHPYTREDVGTALRERLLTYLPPGPPPSFTAGSAAIGGTDQQRAVVDGLLARWRRREPTASVLLAPRGRGKSAALGLALARCPLPSVFTGPSRQGLRTLERFAGRPASSLDRLDPAARVVVVDEAAQIPLPSLRRLVRSHPDAHLAFATTTQGYEGTGRGFVLRFLQWLERERPTRRFELTHPVRWAPGDALEAATDRLFLFDAHLRPLPALTGVPRYQRVSRATLAADEELLRDVWSLLVHAHYRTTPSDLHRLLDAPNMELHLLRCGGRVVAVNLVAREGGLPPDVVEDVARGRCRIRGHALPEVLLRHVGEEEAARWPMLRSVRLATHPDLRRRGLAHRLVEMVHRSTAQVELFGTIFSGDPRVIRLRRRSGYRVIAVGTRASARSGQVAVTMVRPRSVRAARMVARARGAFARDWPVRSALLRADGDAPEELLAAVEEGLVVPAPLDDAARAAMVEGYLHCGRTYASAAPAIEHLVGGRRDLDPALVARAVDRQPWPRIAEALGMSVRATLRRVRRAVAHLVER